MASGQRTKVPERDAAALARTMTRAWRPYRWRAYAVGLLAGLLIGGVVAPALTTGAVLAIAALLGRNASEGPISAAPWDEIAWSLTFALVFAVVGATVLTRWLPSAFKASTEAYIWFVARAETRRGRDEQAAGLANADAAQVRAAIGSMPDRTAQDRFARAAATWAVDFTAGADPRLEPLEIFATQIDDPADRLEAEVAVAVDRARAALAASADWTRPLAEIRPRLGDQVRRPYDQVVWRPAFRSLLVLGLVAVGIYWLGVLLT